MKKIFRLLVFLLFVTTSLKAQKVYFIYLQTDGQQPFYARLGEKIYNSTSAGYLILSNLRDSNYAINIGIQGSNTPDQSYSITVNKKDQGYLIRNFGEKGWGLFNLSSMAVIMSAAITNPVQSVKTEKRDDAFTNLLAKAADDSTIKEKPIIAKTEEKKPEATVSAEKKDELKTEDKASNPAATESSKTEGSPVEKKEEPKVDPSNAKNPGSEIKKNDALKVGAVAGTTAAIIDKDKEPKEDSLKVQDTTSLRIQDTISLKTQDTISIKTSDTTSVKTQDTILTTPEPVKTPAYKRSVVKLKSESSTSTGIGLVFVDMHPDGTTDTVRLSIPAAAGKITTPEAKQEEKRFLDISSGDSVQKDPVTPLIVKNKCSQFASEDDFFKLRRKMAGVKGDDEMINEARKGFKSKCYSTVQVRNLSSLFLTDEFKYKLFDVAYQYVSDLENFPSLQSTLKDEYFINRFKAMLK